MHLTAGFGQEQLRFASFRTALVSLRLLQCHQSSPRTSIPTGLGLLEVAPLHVTWHCAGSACAHGKPGVFNQGLTIAHSGAQAGGHRGWCRGRLCL